MKTVCFRGGCLTGTGHSGAELHGFLAYLVKSVATSRHYTILGYKGKQVRDQIHSRDVVLAFEAFRLNPRSGAVYNLGGGKANSVSILEAIDGSSSCWDEDRNRIQRTGSDRGPYLLLLRLSALPERLSRVADHHEA